MNSVGDLKEDSHVATWKKMLQNKNILQCKDHAVNVYLDSSRNLEEARVVEVE